jgi:hypothetical protein
VRVINHGTDHALPGARTGDSPLYARLGYSTATSPWLDDASWTSPAEQSVTLLDADGRATHRTGFTTLGVRLEASDDGTTAAVAASRAEAHWLTPEEQQHHHGSGWSGEPVDAGTLTVVSIVRGPWEVRCVRVDTVADAGPDGASPVALRISGWPVIEGGTLESTVVPLLGGPEEPGETVRDDANPLGPRSRVPWVDLPVRPGTWVAALVVVRGPAHGSDARPPAARVEEPGDGDPTAPTAVVDWPDGARTTTRLL